MPLVTRGFRALQCSFLVIVLVHLVENPRDNIPGLGGHCSEPPLPLVVLLQAVDFPLALQLAAYNFQPSSFGLLKQQQSSLR